MADARTMDNARWRQMRVDDLPVVHRVANRVHVDYPEDEAVFSERLELYPSGCFVLEFVDQIVGYVISHPWRRKKIPELNSLISALPAEPSTYYLHDIALLPDLRKSGAASQKIAHLIGAAAELGFKTISLVAVNGSTEFWERRGFRAVNEEPTVSKLRTYGGEANFMVREL